MYLVLMLAHRASAQEMVAEIIAGRKRIFDPVAIPAPSLLNLKL